LTLFARFAGLQHVVKETKFGKYVECVNCKRTFYVSKNNNSYVVCETCCNKMSPLTKETKHKKKYKRVID
jgi:hypothetical protein